MCPVQKYTLHMLARYLPGEISHVPTISHISPVRTAGGADGEDLAGP